MTCTPACFEAIIISCNDIVVRANFPANYPLYWIISRPGTASSFQSLTSTDAEGDLTIAKADLPPGYLTAPNNYKIELRNGTNYQEPIIIVFGTESYNCIWATLVKVERDEDDESDINVIEYVEPLDIIP